MASKGQLTGMRGVFLVASELCKRGMIVGLTSRSAAGADLLATGEDCVRGYTVQVKTNAHTYGFWNLGVNGAYSARSHIYVLVNILRKQPEEVEYYVVPSRVVAQRKRVDPNKRWCPTIWREDVGRYKDAWKQFKPCPVNGA